MLDRTTLLPYMAILLGRMSRLIDQTSPQLAEIEERQRQVRSHWGLWRECLRRLRRISSPAPHQLISSPHMLCIRSGRLRGAWMSSNGPELG